MDKKVRERRAEAAVSIAAVEREPGLSKDTLRVWERRYGFPTPARDSKGERAYSPAQLERLRLIRRCMDGGLRPGKIVAASLSELQAQIKKLDGRPRLSADAGLHNGIVDMLKARQIAEIRDYLAHALMRFGVQRFLLEVLTPLSAEVGRAWISGEIEIHEEHVYSEQIHHLLRQVIASASLSRQTPRVMLTTLPGEAHQLGLLMAHASLAVEGADCLSLGVQTPASDVVRAASAHAVDIVGLSFSLACQPRSAYAQLADLRQRLDPRIELWAGGAVWERVRKTMAGTRLLASVSDIPPALADWRQLHTAQAA